MKTPTLKLPSYLIVAFICLGTPCFAVRRLPSEVYSSNKNALPLDGSIYADIHKHRSLVSVGVEVPTSPDGHLVDVEKLPRWRSSESFKTKSWAGLLPASSNDDKYIFYWLFAPDSNVATEQAKSPLVLWLNGGPGCSSMDGLFLENGPIHFDLNPKSKEYELIPAPFAWNQIPAYVLYVDQPVGTGLSFTKSKKYPRNDEEVNVDFDYFLQKFFRLHSDKFVKNNMVDVPFYFSGESHAGHYVPHMMRYILDQNENSIPSNSRINIPLSGAAIGNGWMDPFHQYATAEAAYGHGLLDRAQAAALGKDEVECQNLLNNGKYSNSICFDLLDNVVDQSQGKTSQYKVSQYDVRRAESSNGARDFPPGHKVVETYLGGWPLPGDAGALSESVWKEVLPLLHASASSDANQRFQECTDPPYVALQHQDGKGVVPDIIQVLEHPTKPRLLFFNGIQDLICNHVGNELVLENMEWVNRDAWLLSKRYSWRASTEAEKQISGYMKEYDNLMFLKLMNAGHMVPMDIPDISLDMMRVFVTGQSFETYEQALSSAETRSTSCPVCPTCAYSTDIPKAEENSQSTKHMATYIISYAWIVALIALAAFLLVLMLLRRPRRMLVPTSTIQYDLELRDTQYKDLPVISNKDDGVI